jgi:hypothetical protein
MMATAGMIFTGSGKCTAVSLEGALGNNTRLVADVTGCNLKG